MLANILSKGTKPRVFGKLLGGSGWHAPLSRILALTNTTHWGVFICASLTPGMLSCGARTLEWVMKKHHSKKTKLCAHCGHRFIVNPRVGPRHKFCGKPACKHASKASARKRWLRKNGGRKYFGGKQNIERVRLWRQRNPRYWRRNTRMRRSGLNGFMLTKRLASMLRLVALQDTIDTNLALKIGIISHLSGATLQDTIAKELRRLMLRGHAILRGNKPRS